MMEDLVHAAAAASAASAASTAAAAGVPGPCFPSLLRVLVGGGGMRPELVPLVRRLFPNAVISSAYGMTEAASSITFMVPAIMQGEEQGSLDTSSSSGVGHISSDCALGGVCVGLPAPGVQIAIAAEDDASPSGGSGVGGSSSSTEAGPRVGEVLTRGPHVMSGYWEDPEQTMKVSLLGHVLRLCGAHMSNRMLTAEISSCLLITCATAAHEQSVLLCCVQSAPFPGAATWWMAAHGRLGVAGQQRAALAVGAREGYRQERRGKCACQGGGGRAGGAPGNSCGSCGGAASQPPGGNGELRVVLEPACLL